MPDISRALKLGYSGRGEPFSTFLNHRPVQNNNIRLNRD